MSRDLRESTPLESPRLLRLGQAWSSQSRPRAVAMSISFPAASASVHHDGANSSRTMRPPAASAAAMRAPACSYGIHMATWIAPPPSPRGSSSARTRTRPPTARIHEVLGGTVAARLIPERGAPERHHLGVEVAPGMTSRL